jgi:hypothetical protein
MEVLRPGSMWEWASERGRETETETETDWDLDWGSE